MNSLCVFLLYIRDVRLSIIFFSQIFDLSLKLIEFESISFRRFFTVFMLKTNDRKFLLKLKAKKNSKNRWNFLLRRLNATRIRDNDHRKSKRKQRKKTSSKIFFLWFFYAKFFFELISLIVNRLNIVKINEYFLNFFVNFTRSASESRRVKVLNEFFNSKFWLLSN